jgi:hypothetical protein
VPRLELPKRLLTFHNKELDAEKINLDNTTEARNDLLWLLGLCHGRKARSGGKNTSDLPSQGLSGGELSSEMSDFFLRPTAGAGANFPSAFHHHIIVHVKNRFPRVGEKEGGERKFLFFFSLFSQLEHLGSAKIR